MKFTRFGNTHRFIRVEESILFEIRLSLAREPIVDGGVYNIILRLYITSKFVRCTGETVVVLFSPHAAQL